ncbi:HalOD1 output domain-containing protein [Natronomonas sp. LN261]|uniref:HalOD1 output domain-containing protein n=1 Tax=Natronomonas sp. LN261 TaxID=2750669 RepID=UPI0015EFA939|nr:HalOD1 output domain-containing protein [Natronomonas sp. LN261]
MDRSSTTGSGGSADLLVDIIETLEACGVNRDEYQLYDSIDIEALEQLLNSSTEDVEVQFTVEGVRLAVTPGSVDVLIDEESSPPNP